MEPARRHCLVNAVSTSLIPHELLLNTVVDSVFIFPGIIVALLGGWCGQIYIKAQLSVKREMSNARSPVLGHFGAAIAGLGV